MKAIADRLRVRGPREFPKAAARVENRARMFGTFEVDRPEPDWLLLLRYTANSRDAGCALQSRPPVEGQIEGSVGTGIGVGADRGLITDRMASAAMRAPARLSLPTAPSTWRADRMRHRWDAGCRRGLNGVRGLARFRSCQPARCGC